MTTKDWQTEREAHLELVRIVIETRVPSKWRFVDLETGDVWRWDELLGRFQRAKLAKEGEENEESYGR